MGHERRHAIIVSGYKTSVEEAHEAAFEIFSDDPEYGWQGQMVSPITPGISQGECAFLIAPDGGNEGRSTSNEGDARRDRFIGWLRRRSNEGDYERLFTARWCEVVFGDDHHDLAEVTRHDNED